MRLSSPATLLIALLLGLLLVTGLTNRVDTFLLDSFFRLRGPKVHADDIVIVGIDGRFTEAYPVRLGELDRRFYARALTNLSAAGAQVIGVDLFFPEPSNEAADVELAEAVLNGPVILPQVRTGGGEYVAFNPQLAAARRGVLSLSESARRFRPRLESGLPSFALVLAAEAEAGAVPDRERLIDFLGPAGSFPQLSFLDVYRNQFAYADVQGKTVLLGVTLLGTDRDQIMTPFGEMPGVEVNANEVYSLRHSSLRDLPAPLHALLLIGAALLWPSLTKRKRGLLYALAGVAATTALAYAAFGTGWFVSPLWLALVPAVAYLNTSYRHLLELDRELTRRLIGILDTATAARIDTTPTSLAQGFVPAGHVADAPTMLASLLDGLGGSGGLLFLDKGSSRRGEVSPDLEWLTRETYLSGEGRAVGTMPHHVSEPIVLETGTPSIIGAVGLTLSAPPPPHLRSLLKTSVSTFAQLARYEHLRERSTTLVDSVWPWRGRSSLDKIDALALLGDLLATERGWLGALVETLPQAVFIASPYGYSVYQNASARRLLGREQNLMAALPQALRIAPEQFREDYGGMVGRAGTLELGLSERLSRRSVLLSLRVVLESGEVKGVVGVVSDLSKLEELDKQRQDMVAMIAHDLRSPLTSIQGFAELLLNEAELADAEGSQVEQLGIILSEAERMGRMTDVFLDVSRLEAQGSHLDARDCDLAQLLRYAVASVGTQAAQKDITCEVSAPTHLTLFADPDLLSRLLVNLLNNAVKYSPQATRVRARLFEREAQAVIEIEDQGQGMTEAEVGRLFKKYDRAGGEASRKAAGTGLGLYLVKLIADAHGGEVAVRTAPREGSTFSVSLPLEHAQPSSRHQEPGLPAGND